MTTKDLWMHSSVVEHLIPVQKVLRSIRGAFIFFASGCAASKPRENIFTVEIVTIEPYFRRVELVEDVFQLSSSRS